MVTIRIFPPCKHGKKSNACYECFQEYVDDKISEDDFYEDIIEKNPSNVVHDFIDWSKVTEPEDKTRSINELDYKYHLEMDIEELNKRILQDDL